ncbi:cytochrome c5 family protein [Motilimonas pumila]|uniref:Cytochrome c5 family protein n=1 Tax=Motilimonas pumila TaxID=2303987 RepID=A0A418YHK7_9GAMM|nr:cytochrome c5 family protein [Motilimonas pumila]RJG49570.1 cytochrome c5 family protein [Motilimonas pumila]
MILFVAAFSIQSLASSADMSEDAIAERVKPVGNVYLDGELPDVAAATSSSEASSEPRDGATVYNTKCMACHATGAAGAPIKGDAGQWAARISQGKETLYSHAINGFNAMPAKGTCMDCSDDEIKVAVDYMIEGL